MGLIHKLFVEKPGPDEIRLSDVVFDTIRVHEARTMHFWGDEVLITIHVSH